MLYQHECNEIEIFRLPEDEEYVKETDTGDKPLQGQSTGDAPLGGQESQPTRIGKRSTCHMHQAPN